MSAIISEQKDSGERQTIQKQLEEITNNTALTFDFSQKQILPSSSTFTGHTYSVNALTVLPNGLIASGSRDNTIKFWDLTSNTCVATLKDTHWVCALTVLPNGLLASGSLRGIKLWDLTSKTCVATLTGHTGSVSALTALPNGLLASGSGSGFGDNTIKLWDLTSKACVATLTGHISEVRALTVLSNGLLASGSGDNTIKLWDLTSKTCVATLTGHTDSVSALTVLPNGLLASGSHDNTIKLWDLTSKACVATLTGHTNREYAWVYALTILPNGLLASGSRDNTIKLWDLTSKACVATIEGHTDDVNALTVLPNGMLASGSFDNTIKLWNLTPRLLSLKEITALLEALTTNRSLIELNLPNIHWDDRAILLLQKILSTHPTLQTCDLRNVTLSPAHLNQLYQAFKTRTTRLPKFQLLHEGLVALDAKAKTELPFSSQGTSTLEVKIEKENQSKDVQIEPSLAGTLTGHTEQVQALTVLPNGLLASGSEDTTIQLWDLTSRAYVAILRHNYNVNALTVLPNGLLAGGSFGEIKLWDLTSKACVATLTGHNYNVNALTVLPNGLLAGGSFGEIKLWDLTSKACVATLTGHTYRVNALTVLPNGLLASGSDDKTIKLWDLTSKACVATLTGHTSWVHTLTVLPNELLASGSGDTTIKLWELTSKACVATLIGHTEQVSALTALPNGLLASGSYDKTIKFWDLTSKACVATFTGHTGNVRALTVLPNGLLASGGMDKTIKLWSIPTPNLHLTSTQSSSSTTNASGTIVPIPIKEPLPIAAHVTPAVPVVNTYATSASISNQSNASTTNTNFQELLMQATAGDASAQVELGLCYEQGKGVTKDLRAALEWYTKSAVQGNAAAQQAVVRAAQQLQKTQNTESATTPTTTVPTPASSSSTTAPMIPLSPTIPKITWGSLTLGTLVGNGSYGRVYQGQWQGIQVAIKQLQLETLSAQMTKEFEHETNMMMQCHFPSIVRLYGICTEPGHVAMVMEYLPTSLRQRLHNSRELKWEKRLSIALNIAQGLAYLHSRNIVHRDLKSLNILLDEQEQAKIADFGLAKVKFEVSSTSTKSHNSGSVRWRAPELFKRGAAHNTASDVYSLGMLLWELASRQLPFSDASDDATVISWIKDGEQEKIPDDCPKAFAEIIQSCWAVPTSRPTASDVVTRLQVAIKEIQEATIRKEQELKASHERVWHFDAALKPAPHQMTSGYVLIDAGAKDFEKVVKAYMHGPAQGYDIRSVKIIYNPVLNRSFSLRLQTLQKRTAAAFAPRWREENNPELRDKVNTLFTTMAQPYPDPDYPDVKLLPVWHGTRSDILPSLFNTGFANLASTDAGYFGKGIYSSFEADYAYKVYFKGALLMNWAACRSAYPVIDGDMDKLMGQPNYQNYDTHIVPVVPEFPLVADATSYIPCKSGQAPCYTEMVVFDSSQCLPRYLVELQPSLPKAPIANPALSALLYAFLGNSSTAPAKISGAPKVEEKKAAKVAVKTA